MCNVTRQSPQALAAVVPRAPSGRAHASGYTLLEVAVVLVIIGAIAAISAGSFSHAFDARDVNTARATGETIDGALLNYARENNHLPCPDTNANARAGGAGGSCPPGTEVGYLPYETLALSVPATIQRAVYGVYRNAAIGADLVAPATASSTIERVDFQRALIAAAAVTTVDANHVYITGSGGASGAIDCAANRVLTPAYVVVVPGDDVDGDGKSLDGVDKTLPATPPCFASPNQPPSATFDDHVVFTGFTTLLGSVSTDAP